MKNNMFTPVESERSLIDIGLKSMKYLVHMSLYREAIATFRGCLEHYIQLSVILLSEQLEIDSRDVLENGKLYITNTEPKKGYYTCSSLDFGTINKVNVYVVSKQKPEKNSFKQLREALFNLNTPYTSLFTLAEYTAAFNNCSNKASHGVEQLLFKEYNDFVPFINKFIHCYNIICAKYVFFNTRMLSSLDKGLKECVKISNKEIQYFKLSIDKASSSLSYIINSLQNYYSKDIINSHNKALFCFLRENINKQKEKLSEIELITNRELEEASCFSILVLGALSSGKSTFINLLFNENIFSTTCSFGNENKSILRDNIKITEKCYEDASWSTNKIGNYDLIIFVSNFNMLPKEKQFIKETIHSFAKPVYLVFTKIDQFPVIDDNYVWKFSSLLNIDFTRIFAFNSLQAQEALTSNHVDNQKLLTSGYVNFITRLCKDLLSNSANYKSASFNNIIVTPLYNLCSIHKRFSKTLYSCTHEFSARNSGPKNFYLCDNPDFLYSLNQVEKNLLYECKKSNFKLFGSLEDSIKDWKNYVLEQFINVLNKFYTVQQNNISLRTEKYYKLFVDISRFYSTDALCSKEHKDISFKSLFPDFSGFKKDMSSLDVWNLAKIGLGFDLLSFIKNNYNSLLSSSLLIRSLPRFPRILPPLVSNPAILSLGISEFLVAELLKHLHDNNKLEDLKGKIVKEIKKHILKEIERHDDLIRIKHSDFFDNFSSSIKPIIKMEESLLNEYNNLYRTISVHILHNVFKSLGYTDDDYPEMIKNIDYVPNETLVIYSDRIDLFTTDFKDIIKKSLNLKKLKFVVSENI